MSARLPLLRVCWLHSESVPLSGKIVVEKGIANYPMERWQREGKGKAIFDASFWNRYAM
jgi:hypothetical protein